MSIPSTASQSVPSASPNGGTAAARAVTPRAILIGAVLAPFSCYWVAYTQIRANSTDLTMMSLMAAAFFPLIVLLGINALLRRGRGSRHAFTRGELLTVFSPPQAPLL